MELTWYIRNLYGSHPFYLDTRYFEENEKDGSFTPVKSSKADASKEYTSFSHGVFLRNAHGLEVVTKPQSLTWRALGGSVDLTFYSGPSQAEVTKSYQRSTVGLPAMQQYNTLGYHQCLGATLAGLNWMKLLKPSRNLTFLWSTYGVCPCPFWTMHPFLTCANVRIDIDYMRGYRDFENDRTNWTYEDGEKFLDKLHSEGRRFVPLVDSALYIPNPNNASDA